MVHLLGVNLPDKKIVRVALTYFYGIGSQRAQTICDQLSLHKTCKVGDLSELQVNQLSGVLSGLTIESDLKREIRAHIMHHRQIGSYVGRRHAMGLPVRGQRTRNNAQTAKKLNGRWVRRGFSTLARFGLDAAQSPLERVFNKFNFS
ncbi:mitochondrial 37S ribosomal protein uS13m [Calcarisporiella thermophila]|uniref:mitochondrial 37S ribosomal protein uS13m n=1 Tax=Calcarisporiella thermophila TaxID=911321 RepID=UPI00374327E1